MRRYSTESQKSMVLVVESYHRDLCSDDFKSVAGASISDTDKKLCGDICTGKHNIELHQPRIFCIAVLHL